MMVNDASSKRIQYVLSKENHLVKILQRFPKLYHANIQHQLYFQTHLHTFVLEILVQSPFRSKK